MKTITSLLLSMFLMTSVALADENPVTQSNTTGTEVFAYTQEKASSSQVVEKKAKSKKRKSKKKHKKETTPTDTTTETHTETQAEPTK